MIMNTVDSGHLFSFYAHLWHHLRKSGLAFYPPASSMLSCQQSQRTKQAMDFSTTDYASSMRVHNENFSSTTYVARVLALLTCQSWSEHATFHRQGDGRATEVLSRQLSRTVGEFVSCWGLPGRSGCTQDGTASTLGKAGDCLGWRP
jgi:hypothetical protein